MEGEEAWVQRRWCLGHRKQAEKSRKRKLLSDSKVRVAGGQRPGLAA